MQITSNSTIRRIACFRLRCGRTAYCFQSIFVNAKPILRNPLQTCITARNRTTKWHKDKTPSSRKNAIKKINYLHDERTVLVVPPNGNTTVPVALSYVKNSNRALRKIKPSGNVDLYSLKRLNQLQILRETFYRCSVIDNIKKI